MNMLPDLVVNPSYSPELAELRKEMDEIREEVDELHQEARDGWCDFGDKARAKAKGNRKGKGWRGSSTVS